MKPWPDVEGSYQLPLRPKSAFVGRAVVAVHVTLGASRESAMLPRDRFDRVATELRDRFGWT